MLHVTNGDAAGEKIDAGIVEGEILPWRDVLHDGPVPEGLGDEELAETRAGFLADLGWAPLDRLRADFALRDERLAAAIESGEEVVLWFEHDLYDQLQILQILARYAERPEAAARLSMINIDRFPGVDRFVGLGQLTPLDFASLYPGRAPVTPGQLDLARRAWTAFRSPDPTAVQTLLAGDTAALPFLAAALRRHLEQLPAVGTGLSRSEYQVLEVVGARVGRLDRVFQATQELEDAPFLGDASLWVTFADLASGPRPLLRTLDGGPIGGPDTREEREREVELTEWGTAVLRRQQDWIRLRGGIDRWYGGVHLSGGEPAWRWDGAAGRLVAASTA